MSEPLPASTELIAEAFSSASKAIASRRFKAVGISVAIRLELRPEECMPIPPQVSIALAKRLADSIAQHTAKMTCEEFVVSNKFALAMCEKLAETGGNFDPSAFLADLLKSEPPA